LSVFLLAIPLSVCLLAIPLSVFHWSTLLITPLVQICRLHLWFCGFFITIAIRSDYSLVFIVTSYLKSGDISESCIGRMRTQAMQTKINIGSATPYWPCNCIHIVWVVKLLFKTIKW
jgi:hypothetical protein